MGSGSLTAVERPYRVCDCGAVVWDGRLPKYSETIICPRCGLDHSLTMPLPLLVRYAWRRFRKWGRLYGFLSALTRSPGWFFQYRGPYKPTQPYETPDYTVAPAEPITLLDGRIVSPGMDGHVIGWAEEPA